MLLNLLANSNSLSELESHIADLPTEQQRGEAFEQFYQAFFCFDSVFQFTEIHKLKWFTYAVNVK